MADAQATRRTVGGPDGNPPVAPVTVAERAAPRPGDLHRIVVVGGGAGGLELATRLGDKLGRRNRAHVTLIERARTHFWKPHLHEVAAGSMDIGVYETNYLAQSHWHYFRYRIGEMVGLDRAQRTVDVAPFVDEDGDRVTPQREFPYDTLVIAVGSLTNDFGTPGAKEHAMSLETPVQAERFHRRLVNACIRAHAQTEPLRPEQLHVAIIGAGATGVELAAELHNAARALVSYGLDRIDPEKDIKVVLIEAADRILPALPARLSDAATKLLREARRPGAHVGPRVAEVLANGVRLAGGDVVPAELVVWAAGVKAPDFLKDLDGLETNRINQLVVLPTLQTTRDENIFAIGDCAACPWLGKEGMLVPPRAQSAHQQASHMVGQIERRLAGRPLTPWRYRDFGSLVSLGEHSHRRQSDGRARRPQHVDRRLVRADDVPVAVQAARAGAARVLEGLAGHRGAGHHPANRNARKAALNADPHAITRRERGAGRRKGDDMANPVHDPAQLLAQMFKSGQSMMQQFAGATATEAAGTSDPMAAIAAASQQMIGMQQDFWKQVTGFWSGMPGAAMPWGWPAGDGTDDKRFAGEAWRNDPRFDVVKRTYLAYSSSCSNRSSPPSGRQDEGPAALRRAPVRRCDEPGELSS